MTKPTIPSNAPLWAVRPEALLEVGRRHARAVLDPGEARVHSALTAAPAVAGQVVVIQILDFIDQRYWASCEQISAFLAQLATVPDVKAIILEIDSPGGSVYGVPELAKQIRTLRETKRVVAIANSLAASAAYWIGSACSEFWVTPGGEVGSIGVWQMHVDLSKELEALGVDVTLISAGKYKVEGNPWEPLSEEAKAFLQQRIDEYYDLFVRDVAEGRGVKVAQVKDGFGQGRVLGAKEALAEGMVDKIGTLPELLAKVGARRGGAPRAVLERRQKLVEAEGA